MFAWDLSLGSIPRKFEWRVSIAHAEEVGNPIPCDSENLLISRYSAGPLFLVLLCGRRSGSFSFLLAFLLSFLLSYPLLFLFLSHTVFVCSCISVLLLFLFSFLFPFLSLFLFLLCTAFLLFVLSFFLFLQQAASQPASQQPANQPAS
jgi:hypothetical protein